MTLKTFLLSTGLWLAACVRVAAQGAIPVEEDFEYDGIKEMPSLINLQFYRSKRPVIIDGEPVWDYLMPELPVYKPMKFKSERERQQYNRLVNNIKRVLPLARKANMMLTETFEVLETLPTKEAKDAHIKAVERDIKAQYTPEMKKLTKNQGKTLIKLVNRETNQRSYYIVKAFLGTFRAGFWQTFGRFFGVNMREGFHPSSNKNDAMIERICTRIEQGVL